MSFREHMIKVWGKTRWDAVKKRYSADGTVSERHKHRNLTEERDLLKRLNRIEGQVRGVKAMVEDERYCVDILNQVSAIQAALNSFSRELLSNHIKTCVVDDIEAGNGEEAVEELCRTIQKLMK